MKLPAAYCKLHKRRLTWRQIRHHGCMSTRKQRGGRQYCRWLRRNEDHPAWAERQRRIEARKRGKKQEEGAV